MKQVVTFLLIVTIVSVDGFAQQELLDMLCEVNTFFIRRYVTCVISEVPYTFKQHIDTIYACMEEYTEIGDIVESMMLYICNKQPLDPYINQCTKKKSPDYQEPSDEERKKITQAYKTCISKA